MRRFVGAALGFFSFLASGLPCAHAQLHPFGGIQHYPIRGLIRTGSVVGRFNLDSSQDVFQPAIHTTPTAQGWDNRIQLLGDQGQLLNPSVVRQSVFNPVVSVDQHKAAAGDLDGDGLDDLVILDTQGGLSLQLNLGSTGTDRAQVQFGPPRRVETLGASLSYAFPRIASQDAMHSSKIMVLDLNQDSRADVVVASAIGDQGNGHTLSNPVFVYLGDGQGNLLLPPVAIPLGVARNPTDFEFKDLNGDGWVDRLFVLEEERSWFGSGIFDTWIEIFDIQLSTPSAVPVFNRPQNVGDQPVNLGGSRASSFEVENVSGSPDLDFVFSVQTCLSFYTMQSRIDIFEGSAGGGLPLWTTASISVPGFTGNTEIPSVQVADFNGDGSNDIAALVGYEFVQNSAILYLAGPFVTQATPQTINLGLPYSRVLYFSALGALGNYKYGPARTSPDELLRLDLDGDGRMELALTGSRSSFQPMMTVLENLTDLPNQDPRLVIEGTGTPHPVLGELQMTGTGEVRPGKRVDVNLLNAPDHAFASLMYGDFRLDFQILGLQLHTPGYIFSNLFTTGTTPIGRTHLLHTIPLPNHPSLVGVEGVFQWNLYDVGLAQLASSPALVARVGN